jgi:hypothetical protein
VIRGHQPGSEPIDIPETIPNPVVVPKPAPTPTEPAPKEPVRIPEKVPYDVLTADSCTSRMRWTAKVRRGSSRCAAPHPHTSGKVYLGRVNPRNPNTMRSNQAQRVW